MAAIPFRAYSCASWESAPRLGALPRSAAVIVRRYRAEDHGLLTAGTDRRIYDAVSSFEKTAWMSSCSSSASCSFSNVAAVAASTGTVLSGM